MGDPAGGSSPSCRAIEPLSKYASFAVIRSSSTVTTSHPSTSTLAPVGANPWKLPGPANVARARQRTAVRFRYVVRSRISNPEVRKRGEQRLEVRAYAVGRDQILLADEAVDAAGLPARDRGVEILLGERLEVLALQPRRWTSRDASLRSANIVR